MTQDAFGSGLEPPSQEFIKKVENEVSELLSTFPVLGNRGHAFALWAARFLHQIDDEEAFEATASVVEGPGDGGIDAIWADEPSSVLYLMQCKFSDQLARTFDEAAAQELFAGLDRLLSETYAATASNEFQALRRRVQASLDGEAELVLQVVLGGTISEEARRRIGAQALLYSGMSVRVEVIDALTLYATYIERSTSFDLADETIRFRLLAGHIAVPARDPRLRAAVVTVLDGKSLVDAVAAHGRRLVAGNVRYLLKTSKINDTIAASIRDESDRQIFGLLNNGLTITADEIDFSSEGVALVTNPQIVNGGQTTMTLFENRDFVAEGAVSVVARFISTRSDESGKELAQLVAASTNRQNAINAADLRSNDAIQLKLQADFRALPEPFFYERRRNERASLTEHEKAVFERRIVTKEEVAQRWRAYTGYPATAITRKKEIFEKPEVYGEVFGGQVTVSEYLLAHQLFAFFYRLLDGRATALRAIYAPRIDDGERASLARARNQFAAHGAAIVGKLLKEEAEETFGPTESLRFAQWLAASSLDSSGKYVPALKLTARVELRWFRTKRAEFAEDESGELLNVKTEFERPATFPVLYADAVSRLEDIGGLGI